MKQLIPVCFIGKQAFVVQFHSHAKIKYPQLHTLFPVVSYYFVRFFVYLLFNVFLFLQSIIKPLSYLTVGNIGNGSLYKIRCHLNCKPVGIRGNPRKGSFFLPAPFQNNGYKELGSFKSQKNRLHIPVTYLIAVF